MLVLVVSFNSVRIKYDICFGFGFVGVLLFVVRMVCLDVNRFSYLFIFLYGDEGVY